MPMSPIQNGSGLVYPLRFLKRSFFLTHIFYVQFLQFPESCISHTASASVPVTLHLFLSLP
jgi:hypothetical protein